MHLRTRRGQRRRRVVVLQPPAAIAEQSEKYLGPVRHDAGNTSGRRPHRKQPVGPQFVDHDRRQGGPLASGLPSLARTLLQDHGSAAGMASCAGTLREIGMRQLFPPENRTTKGRR
jgi:hypothetical protein